MAEISNFRIDEAKKQTYATKVHQSIKNFYTVSPVKVAGLMTQWMIEKEFHYADLLSYTLEDMLTFDYDSVLKDLFRNISADVLTFGTAKFENGQQVVSELSKILTSANVPHSQHRFEHSRCIAVPQSNQFNIQSSIQCPWTCFLSMKANMVTHYFLKGIKKALLFYEGGKAA